MKKSRRNRRKTNRHSRDILNMIVSFISIALAIFVVIFVYEKIRGADFLPSLEMTSQTSVTETFTETTEADIEEEKYGFIEDSEGNFIYILEDGSQAFDMWLVENNKLYYFNDKGYLQTSPYSEFAMNFTFEATGEVKSIKYNPNYKPDEGTAIQGFDNLVKNKHLWVYNDMSRKNGSFYALMYKSTTEAMSYVVGTDSNIQYSSPNSVQLKDDYIYYLPYTSSPSDEDKEINKKLFRIKAGDTVRYIGCENVEGYKLVDDAVFVYSDNEIKMISDDDFKKDDSINTSWMNAEAFNVDIEKSPGRIYLKSKDGVLARGYTSEDYFKAGNFYYKLSPDGEILDVKDKTSVNIGGYTYKVEMDRSFGHDVSRVIRLTADGKKEIISSEFNGSVKNMHYDYESKCIYAEYLAEGDISRIVRITLDGDVDYLEDQGLNGGQLKLMAIQNDRAVVKESVGELVNYYELRTRAVVPLAISVDPVLVIDEDIKNNEAQGPGIVIENGPGMYLDNNASSGDSAVVGGQPGQ